MVTMIKILSMLVLASALVPAGCASPANVDSVPVGTVVEVVREDGGVVKGTLTERDEETVKVDVGTASRSVPRDEIANVRVVDDTKPPAPLPAIATFRELTVAAGTKLVVRLESAVGSDTSRVEDPVEAVLTEALVVDGMDVFPVGSIVKGGVAAADPAGKVKGRARLALRFTSISVAGRDEPSPIMARIERVAASTTREDAAKIAIPAAGGAIIGGLIGGKKGAANGTAVGGGGGTAVVLSTAGDEVRLARGASLTLPIEQAVDVRVPIARAP